MSKKRSIISYDKLTADQIKELEAAYPNGYQSALTQIKTPTGETIDTLLWETEEIIYLVKMIRPKNQVVFDDDDNDDDDEREDFDIETGSGEGDEIEGMDDEEDEIDDVADIDDDEEDDED